MEVDKAIKQAKDMNSSLQKENDKIKFES